MRVWCLIKIALKRIHCGRGSLAKSLCSLDQIVTAHKHTTPLSQLNARELTAINLLSQLAVQSSGLRTQLQGICTLIRPNTCVWAQYTWNETHSALIYANCIPISCLRLRAQSDALLTEKLAGSLTFLPPRTS